MWHLDVRLAARHWLPAVLTMLAALLLAMPAHSAPLAQAGGTLVGKQGTVSSNLLNVRSAPALTGKVIGQLRAGTRVTIRDAKSDWLQIDFPGGPGGRGWVSTQFVTVDGASRPATPTPASPGGNTRPAGQAPAPSVVDFRPPTFSWNWPGNAADLGSQDWYFDIQVYQKFAQNPYMTVVAEPGDVSRSGGSYSYEGPHFNIKCDSFWVAQIAVRQNGRFKGWISPKSDPYYFGPQCSGGGDRCTSKVQGDTNCDGVCDTDCGGQTP